MNYSVEQLAEAAGVRVDTVRYYQAQGLLPPPKRAGRRALYSDAHLKLLRRIRELQREGLPLAVIKRMLEGGKGKRRATALERAIAEQRGEQRLTRADLASASGVSEELIAAVENAGLFEPVKVGGEPRYGEADVAMARAALALLREGFPLTELLGLAITHASNTREVAERAADLFERYVRRTKSGEERPEQEVVESFKRLMPAITSLVAHHFQRTLIAVALARLEERGEKRALEVALDATESGRLEVTWR
ncbi:MAG TPA: MerR family transcriptional regulator [Candidatus Binatia bacterium]